MSSKTASRKPLPIEQELALCQAIGHMAACANLGSIHADREAKFVRDLVRAFGMEHLQSVSDVANCFEMEVSA